MAVSDYSTTANDNTTLAGQTVTDATVIDTVDNLIRSLMADTKGFYDDVQDGTVFSGVEAAVRTALNVPYFYSGTYTGDLDALGAAGVLTIATLADGVSNGFSNAGDNDYVFDFHADADNGFQFALAGDGTLWRRVEQATNWSTWTALLTQVIGLGNSISDIGTNAPELVSWGVVSDGSSGGFTVAYDHGCTVTRASEGTYTVSFSNTRANTNYQVLAMTHDGNRSIAANSKGTGSFSLITRQVTTGDLTDSDSGFSFEVKEPR